MSAPDSQTQGEAATAKGPIARILQNAGWLLAGKGVGALLSVFYLAAAARGLGPAGFGQFALVLGLGQGISRVVSFQSWRIIIRFGTHHVVHKDMLGFSRLALFCTLLDMATAITGCALAGVGVWLLAPHFGWSPDTAFYATLYAFVVLLTIRSSAAGILRVHDRFRDGAVADSFVPLARFVGAVAVIAAGPSVTGFLIAWGASEIASMIANWYFVARHAPFRLDRAVRDGILNVPSENRGFWGFAGFTNASGALIAALNQLPLFVVGVMAGPVAAGLFRFAYQLGSSLQQLGEMLSRALFAELSRENVRQGKGAVRSLYLRTSRLAFLGGAIVIALIAILGKPALYLIGGSAYLPAYPVMLLLGGAAATDLAGVSFEPTLLAAGRPGVVLTIRAAALAIMVALFFVFSRINELGAAAATLGASLATLAMFRIVTHRVTR